ncbi:hypothetical protein C0J52_14974 [Blattella germanica]|nr:hypothetical protein C0J52_14974 [Blattella germanica]
MGRKIPGRKHRGVKDPEIQRAKRNELLKDKINAPPQNLDFQEIPKSLRRISQINKAIKDGTFKMKKTKKKKKRDLLIDTTKLEGKNVKLPGMTRPEKPIPSFVQRPGESDDRFLYRIEQACHSAIQESKFEDKYGVTVNVNHETGETTIKKKPKEELDDLEMPLLKNNNNKPWRKNREPSKKKEKKKMKEKEMKLKKEENSKDEFEHFHDEVKFGEVVHAPPSFSTLPKRAVSKDITGRPGKKDLLLKTVLQSNGDSSPTTSKVKWKKMPVIAKEKMELQRLRAVEAYRMMKAQNRRNT